jgi:hypothetical protein
VKYSWRIDAGFNRLKPEIDVDSIKKMHFLPHRKHFVSEYCSGLITVAVNILVTGRKWAVLVILSGMNQSVLACPAYPLPP